MNLTSLLCRATLSLVVLVLLVATPACGDDGGAPGDPDGGGTDGGTLDGAPGDADAGQSDSGPGDGGGTDGGGTDGGGTDGGGTDGGGTDGGGTDGGAVDSGDTDGGGTADGGTDGGTDSGGTDSGGTADAALDGGPAPGAPAVYLARRDYRRCAYPLCGGFWLHAVNRASTMCADGSRDTECYVADIDWTALGLSAAEASDVEASAGNLLVSGAAELRSLGGRTIGVLAAAEAWHAEWGTGDIAAGSTTFYSVQDSGLRCLVAPCFNLDVVVLNVGTSDAVSGLGLTGAGATAADVTRGHSAAAAGDLRVVGTISTDTTPGPTGAFGRTLDARQFFLPVR
ncbi:MAG: hypothetical protein JRH11_13270 [Deltaproteobacteria bacterium]|nr:hypothetical protein [Deltaproteobacteria bacterium]